MEGNHATIKKCSGNRIQNVALLPQYEFLIWTLRIISRARDECNKPLGRERLPKVPLAERSMAFLVSSSLSDIIQFDKRIVPQNRSFKILCFCFFLGWLYRRKKLECAHCGHILVKEITKNLFEKSCSGVFLVLWTLHFWVKSISRYTLLRKERALRGWRWCVHVLKNQFKKRIRNSNTAVP